MNAFRSKNLAIVTISGSTVGRIGLATGLKTNLVAATKICADDLLLHFPFEDNYDDASCHHAIATQYGCEVGIQYDSTRAGKVACFTGKSHLEVNRTTPYSSVLTESA